VSFSRSAESGALADLAGYQPSGERSMLGPAEINGQQLLFWRRSVISARENVIVSIEFYLVWIFEICRAYNFAPNFFLSQSDANSFNPVVPLIRRLITGRAEMPQLMPPMVPMLSVGFGPLVANGTKIRYRDGYPNHRNHRGHRRHCFRAS
jgi:hypothetical protein